MRKITDLFLRFVARDIQALLDFIGRLDVRLDAYIATREGQIDNINDQIIALQKQRSDVTRTRDLAVGLQKGVQNLRG